MSTKQWVRLFGLWIVLTELGMAANRSTTIDAVSAVFSNPGIAWVTGVFTLLVGLVVLVTHNRWSGGLSSTIVTLFGWIAVVKGLLFVWFPAGVQQHIYAALHFDRYYYGYLVFGLLLGGYLIYDGFRSPAAAPSAKPQS